MRNLESDNKPFEKINIIEKNVHWIKPELVGEFKFTEWTDENRLRHPSFLGLRDDKDPHEVHKE